ncbi:MAG: ATP-binding protein [Patescibacteria group bacterium]
MYKRTLLENIVKSQREGFVTLIYGARRVGKTILLQQIRETFRKEDGEAKILHFNGDTEESVKALSTNSEVALTQLVKNHDVIFVDEAQRIPGVTLALKIVTDLFPQKRIFVTGSSSLQLSSGAKEHLTGRNNAFSLYPLSTRELAQDLSEYKISGLLDNQLLYGGYPYVYALATHDEKKRYLTQIVEDYLFKDVLMLERLDYPDVFRKVATLIAFQIGKEVSLNEIANSLNVSVKTVARYLDLLEKSFVIFHLDAFSRNPRKEITQSKKYYFYDLGIRNALIEQFQPAAERPDIGQLWENFVVVERMKASEYKGEIVQRFFWRSRGGTEIDLIEVVDGRIEAFECKWSKGGGKTPSQFVATYGKEVQVVNRENYPNFI